MKVIDPGHRYTVTQYDAEDPTAVWFIQFMKRKGEMYPGNVGHYPGTNCQELIRVLINRLEYLDRQIPSRSNGRALNYLRAILFELELRAAKRHGLEENFIGLMRKSDVGIEALPTCLHCGHVVCATPRWEEQQS